MGATRWGKMSGGILLANLASGCGEGDGRDGREALEEALLDACDVRATCFGYSAADVAECRGYARYYARYFAGYYGGACARAYAEYVNCYYGQGCRPLALGGADAACEEAFMRYYQVCGFDDAPDPLPDDPADDEGVDDDGTLPPPR